MKLEIKVPAMGESITEATVGTIIKATGSAVATDDELLELETDKVNQVLYAPNAGVLTLNVSPHDVVKIGQVIGFVDTEASKANAKTTEGTEKSEKPEKAVTPKGEPKEKGQEKVTEQKGGEDQPKPKKPEKAKEKEQEKPSAPKKAEAAPQKEIQGKPEPVRITKETFVSEIKAPDRETPPKAPSTPAATPKASGERETRKRMSNIRKVIAKRLVESQQNTAMLTTFNEVDMTEVIALREKYKEAFSKQHGTRLGFMSFFVKASVSALKEVPELNSYVDGDDIVHREYYDIGIAVGTDRGLVVPVVRDCDRLTFAEIESSIEAYGARARDGKLTVEDLTGGGFTITNGGVYGSLLSTPIINPPQSGILGMHKILKRPMAVNDKVVIKPMMYLALSYDHRIVDGKGAVTFLVHIKNCLEDPARLLIEV